MSSRMGMSKLSSALLSTPRGPQGSLPAHTDRQAAALEQTHLADQRRVSSQSEELGVCTFPVELQRPQQADRLQHLSDVHLQTALQLDEEPADLRVDLPVFGPGDGTCLGLVGGGGGGIPANPSFSFHLQTRHSKTKVRDEQRLHSFELYNEE